MCQLHATMCVADDYGHAFAPNNRPDVHMPNLNSLASTGLVVSDFYTYQFCSPSRAAFLTGRYPWRQTSARNNYMPASSPDGIDLAFNMVPARLASKGYVSYHVGKWYI